MHYEKVHCTTRPVQWQAAPCALVPRVHATAYLDGVQGHESHVSAHALRVGASFGRSAPDRKPQTQRGQRPLCDASIPPRLGRFHSGNDWAAGHRADHLVTEIGPVIVLPAF
ncbi:hypothetical protein M404DRAFT_996186 [Pisolithus tinctorius Marx 270]|uniref:Uncharacterized protein n=1 Tax=Pisolithus tinctorius Marx 270 TaxID=870435 RepID=A0A0C3PM33_PISTI|nr:hypothetical protein M404DRAFT_996186 [Pisolithus tinctorius Marx 270]